MPTSNPLSAKQSHALYLVIDQGGHASRAMVFDTKGIVVAQAVQNVGVSHPQPGWVEQDPDELVTSIQQALVEIAHTLGDQCQKIVAAGLATQRSNIVCWNRNTGAALSPAISWQDHRAAKWLQPFERHSSQIRHITGLLPSAHYGVSKLHWCYENLAPVKTAHNNNSLAWGPLASFLLFRLLEEQPFVVDPANASRTLLWDIKTRDWSNELCSLFGHSHKHLPRCVPSQYDFGHLKLQSHKVPLVVCNGDQSAALFSLGKPQPETAYINMGTGAFLQCVNNKNIKPPTRLLRSVVWANADKAMYSLEATINGCASALLEIEDELNISPKEAQKAYPQWLASAKHIPLFLNGVSGLAAPFWVPDFQSKFVGKYADNAEPWEKLVAVGESILFLLQTNLEEMQQEGANPKQIIISGGLSAVNGLCQRLADLSNLPIARPKQCEATAKGLAFLVANPEPMWEMGETTYFTPQKNEALAARYKQWTKALSMALNLATGNKT